MGNMETLVPIFRNMETKVYYLCSVVTLTPPLLIISGNKVSPGWYAYTMFYVSIKVVFRFVVYVSNFVLHAEPKFSASFREDIKPSVQTD